MRILALTLLSCLCFSAFAEPLRFRSEPGQVSVLELYTSQGCSSCPPADAWLSRLQDSPDLWQRLIPMAFHVDYWDRLGWSDPFAAETHTRRQYRYRAVGATPGVYTPGFVLNGRDWRGWRRGQSPVGEGLPGPALTAILENGALQVTYDSDRSDLVFNIAVLGMDLETAVGAGENGSRRLHEDFVVLAWQRYPSGNAQWKGALPEVQAEAERTAIVIWVNEAGDPSPLQAVAGWLPR